MKKKLSKALLTIAALYLLTSPLTLTMKTSPLPPELKVQIEYNNNLTTSEVVNLPNKTELEHVLMYTELDEEQAKKLLKSQTYEEIIETERGNNVKMD